jgi:Transcription factor WhiB
MSQDVGISPDRELLTRLTDQAIRAEVASQARCADGGLEPDAWFPISTDTEAARREAARAIAVCAACPVRTACLELSLRQWAIGQHGVWGGLVAPERVALRRRWLATSGDRGHVLSLRRMTADVAVARREDNHRERATCPPA